MALYLFWATLLACRSSTTWRRVAAVEATTAASALLVASSGRRSALEAGWKYLVLTTLGLAIALLGIVVLYAAIGGGSLATLDWSSIGAAGAGLDARRARCSPWC